mmetsp:Transcript_4626/g.8026  ORF Transcript_4626/g.8026 Transcript_4626/m.8026 type:complete len:249 (-) Transcript_4626:700-1446(-)
MVPSSPCQLNLHPSRLRPQTCTDRTSRRRPQHHHSWSARSVWWHPSLTILDSLDPQGGIVTARCQFGSKRRSCQSGVVPRSGLHRAAPIPHQSTGSLMDHWVPSNCHSDYGKNFAHIGLSGGRFGRTGDRHFLHCLFPSRDRVPAHSGLLRDRCGCRRTGEAGENSFPADCQNIRPTSVRCERDKDRLVPAFSSDRRLGSLVILACLSAVLVLDRDSLIRPILRPRVSSFCSSASSSFLVPSESSCNE